MSKSVLQMLARKRKGGISHDDSIWDTRARQELALNWSEHVDSDEDFDGSAAALRDRELISHDLCAELPSSNCRPAPRPQALPESIPRRTGR
jgi:hypothetical protein